MLSVPAPAARAAETLPGPVPARVLRVIDGDTLEVAAKIWLGQAVTVRVRLDGIDTPERRGRCAAEKAMAEQARELVARHAGGRNITLSAIHYGKYAGRVVARVALEDGADLAALLTGAGLARLYTGGRRESWCG